MSSAKLRRSRDSLGTPVGEIDNTFRISDLAMFQHGFQSQSLWTESVRQAADLVAKPPLVGQARLQQTRHISSESHSTACPAKGVSTL
jgi:hypothetical protein